MEYRKFIEQTSHPAAKTFEREWYKYHRTYGSDPNKIDLDDAVMSMFAAGYHAAVDDQIAQEAENYNFQKAERDAFLDEEMSENE